MSDPEDALRKLHTRLLDAREGYAEGIELADKPSMIVLFRELHDLHGDHARALEQAMAAEGNAPDRDGSFMAEIHKAVLNVRSALTGLEENVIPSIRDGEKRILASYDDALAALPPGSALATLVEGQREALSGRIAMLDHRVADS